MQTQRPGSDSLDDEVEVSLDRERLTEAEVSLDEVNEVNLDRGPK